MCYVSIADTCITIASVLGEKKRPRMYFSLLRDAFLTDATYIRLAPKKKLKSLSEERYKPPPLPPAGCLYLSHCLIKYPTGAAFLAAVSKL